MTENRGKGKIMSEQCINMFQNGYKHQSSGLSRILDPFIHKCFLQKLEQSVGSVKRSCKRSWNCVYYGDAAILDRPLCMYQGNCSCLYENVTGVWVDSEVLL